MHEEWSINLEPDSPCQRCEEFQLALEEYFDYFSTKFDLPRENFSISIELQSNIRKKLVYVREQSRKSPHKNTHLIEQIDEEGEHTCSIYLSIDIIGLQGNTIEELKREVNVIKREFLGEGDLFFDPSEETIIDLVSDEYGIQRKKRRSFFSLSIVGQIDFSEDDMSIIEESRMRAVEFQRELKYAVESMYFSRIGSTVIDKSNIGIFINTDQKGYIVQVAIPYINECPDATDVTNLIREQMNILSAKFSGIVSDIEDNEKYFHIVYKFP